MPKKVKVKKSVVKKPKIVKKIKGKGIFDIIASLFGG